MSQRFVHSIDVGDRLSDRYEVIEVLGQGGMGTVYKAMHLQLSKPVAVKALHPQIVLDQNSMARFQQEIRAMSMLSHPHLISVLDAGTTASGTPFFVMEFLDGPSLGDLLRSQGPPPDLRAFRMFVQMADALAYAHEQNIIHRDLKPSNVVVLSSNRKKDFIKLVDLGIAKLLEPRTGEQGLTMTGEIFGSPLYMSPEQCLGRAVDGRSDIYSLGCLMYETVTGETPIKGNNALETFNMHINNTPPPISERLSTRMTPALKLLEPIIDKCMRKPPNERFQTMAELSQALEDAEHLAKSAATGNAVNADAMRSDAGRALRYDEPQSVSAKQLSENEERRSIVNPHASLVNPQAAQVRISEQVSAQERNLPQAGSARYAAQANDARYSPQDLRPVEDNSPLTKVKSALFNRYAFAGIGTFAVVLIFFFAAVAFMHHEPPAVAPPAVISPSYAVNVPGVSYNFSRMGAAVQYEHYNVSMPNPSAKEKVIVVAVYAGAGQENDDIQHFRGNVEVTVGSTGKPVDLVLSSYMATNWIVKRQDDNVQIRRIMASGYKGPVQVKAPPGVKVESAYYTNVLGDHQENTHKYSENPFSIFVFVPLGNIDFETNKSFLQLKKTVQEHLGQPVSQMYGCYREGKFTVE